MRHLIDDADNKKLANLVYTIVAISSNVYIDRSYQFREIRDAPPG